MRFLTSQYHLAVVSLLAFRRSVVFVKELVPGHCVTLAVRDIYEEPFASPLSAKPHSARLPGRCLLRKNFLVIYPVGQTGTNEYSFLRMARRATDLIKTGDCGHVPPVVPKKCPRLPNRYLIG